MQEDVEVAITRTLLTRFELGQFDPPELNPFTRIPFDVVGSEAHLKLAQAVASDSIVLLKNIPAAPEEGKRVIEPGLGSTYA